ncbi:MAG: hypothetical protein JSW50_07000, partial [Candidatus Latescibacterota bacterium]
MSKLLVSIIFVMATTSALWGAEPQSPRPVSVSIFVIDILEIDSARQTVLIDFVVRVTWRDESLATPGGEIRALDPEDNWTPRIQIVGDLGMERVADLFEVTPEGTVFRRIRYVGTLSSRMH